MAQQSLDHFKSTPFFLKFSLQVYHKTCMTRSVLYVPDSIYSFLIILCIESKAAPLIKLPLAIECRTTLLTYLPTHGDLTPIFGPVFKLVSSHL